jgi:hypothetical protein
MASPPVIDAPIGRATTTADFSWPEFDRWQAAFAAAAIWPPGWEGLQCAPPAPTREAEAYRVRKLTLFCEWLDMVARRPAVRAHYARQGIRVQVVRQDERAPCPACDPVHGRELGPELDAMPPFHPGCRCVLVAMHATPVDRRERS